MPLRVNLVLSPKLSLQLYTQALLSTGEYPTIKELGAPRTYDFPVYGVDVGTLGLAPDTWVRHAIASGSEPGECPRPVRAAPRR